MCKITNFVIFFSRLFVHNGCLEICDVIAIFTVLNLVQGFLTFWSNISLQNYHTQRPPCFWIVNYREKFAPSHTIFPCPFLSILPSLSPFSPPLFSHPVCLHVWNAKKTLWLCWLCWESVSSCLVINGKENKSRPKEFGFWTFSTLFITQKWCQGGKPAFDKCKW